MSQGTNKQIDRRDSKTDGHSLALGEGLYVYSTSNLLFQINPYYNSVLHVQLWCDNCQELK